MGSKRRRLSSPARETISEGSFGSGLELSNQSNVTDVLAGKIESLHMVNFMCHANLRITFNKRITFVTGRNGSGKSTIMAALIIALGGSAKVTGRGSKVADFIKKGETWAKISVTLANEGLNSYKKDLYGDRITISRTISSNQTTSYVCKSESNEVITRKKEDVDKIRTALNLQINNPICILNQDVARSFLSSTDGSVRYALFGKATHLENLKSIYADTIDLLRITRGELEKKKSSFAEASKEIRQLKEKLEYFATLEKYVNERTSLENEYLWSLVSDEERTLDRLMRRKEEMERKEAEIEESDASFRDGAETLEGDIRETKERLAGVGGGNEADRARLKELNAELQGFQRRIDAASAHVKQLATKRDRQDADIKSLREHLEKTDEVATQSKAERERIADRIKALEEELIEVRDRIETARLDADNGEETRLQHAMTLDGLKSDVKDLERARDSLRTQLNATNARKSSGNLLKFGPFTAKLKELIDDAAKRNQFHRKPVGPCGMYVTLAGDGKWARAVESVVRGLMNTYCCDNQRDFQVLTRLMDKVCPGKHPPVIISKFQNGRHNVSDVKVSVRGLSTVLDVLSFSSDVVFNTFVDQARLETILLFEDDAQAASLLSHVQNVPKHVRMGLTVQSDQYYPAPNYRTYCGDRARSLKYFDSPARGKAAAERADAELRDAMKKIKDKNMEVADVTSKLMKIADFLAKAESNLKLLRQSERRIESEIGRLRDEEASRPVLPTRLALEEELAVLEASQEELRGKIAEEEDGAERLRRDREERAREAEAINERERSARSEASALRERLDELKQSLSSKRAKMKNLSAVRDGIRAELRQLDGEMSSRASSLEERLRNAREIHGERIVTERSPEEVQKLLHKCEKYLQAAERKIESKEIVIKEYRVKHDKYRGIKEEIDVLERVTESVLKMAVAKKERFALLQSYTANLVSFHFQACLQTRGYDGQLKFDFENQVLELEVVPKEGLARKDAKTLSGGERSYSTVSFILAIWRAVQMPFYFLDEFDVFMDKVNRKIIMDLLLDHAKNQDKMQFIFITPQDVSSVQVSDAVSMYKMPDPATRVD